MDFRSEYMYVLLFGRSVAEDGREEEAGDVLLLPFKYDWLVFSTLGFIAQQVEELFEGYQVIVKGLWLHACSDTTASSVSPTTHLTQIVRVVLSEIALF